MAIRIEKNKSLFSRLQSFAFLPLTPKESDAFTYHLDVESQELFSRVRGNIQKLQDAHLKMDFMLDEIQYVLRKKF